jgi:hypothetical protein
VESSLCFPGHFYLHKPVFDYRSNSSIVVYELRYKFPQPSSDGQFCGGANVLPSTLTAIEPRIFGKSGSVPI